jgi:hypothetical protein
MAVSTTPINIDQQASSFLSVNGQMVPSEGPRAIPLALDFTQTIQYSLNLQNITQRNFITMIQSAWIDNSANGSTMTLSFPNTQQRMIFPAGFQGYVSLLCPNPPQMYFASAGDCIVYVELLNYPVSNTSWNVNGTEGTGAATVFSGQQTVTESAVALSSHPARAVTIKSANTNTVPIYVGPVGVSDATGYEMDPGDILTLPVNNSNLIYVISGSTAQVISYVGTL